MRLNYALMPTALPPHTALQAQFQPVVVFSLGPGIDQPTRAVYGVLRILDQGL